MNTIIYVYRGKHDSKFHIEKLQEQDYCLIRLGLPAPLWKHLKAMDTEEQDKPAGITEASTTRKKGIWSNDSLKRWGILSRWWKESVPKRQKDRGRKIAGNVSENTAGDLEENRKSIPKEALAITEKEIREAERKQALRQQVQALLDELESLQTAICLLGENTYWTYTVYASNLRTKINTPCWWKYWKIPEFENYNQPLWAEKILSHGTCYGFLILGQSDCIPDMLLASAGSMRSAKWYLLQKDYTEETEAFIENFYEDYGLAIELHLLENQADWGRQRFECREPIKVLDFSGTEKVSVYGVPEGSVWLDMNAMDAKSRRMEVRNQGIDYFSLKKLWGQLQKPSNTLTPM